MGTSINRIAIVGTGYVGLAYPVALAELGNRVIGLDIEETRIRSLTASQSPLFEPGLDGLLTKGLESGRLSFTSNYSEAIGEADFVFLCVGTPSLSNGKAVTPIRARPKW